MNCATLIRANGLGKSALIIAGQKLLIPGRKAVATTGSNQPTGISSGARATAAEYRVKSGDTACAIAKRFGVACRALISHNRLGRNAVIYVGQKLGIPGAVTVGDGLNADNQYIVRAGDSACRVARKFRVNCRELQRLNDLAGAAIIHPGQKLKIPGLVVPETSATAEQLARVADLTPSRSTAKTAADALPDAGDEVVAGAAISVDVVVSGDGADVVSSDAVATVPATMPTPMPYATCSIPCRTWGFGSAARPIRRSIRCAWKPTKPSDTSPTGSESAAPHRCEK